VTRHQSPIDHRPFQAKAQLEKQEALVSRYGAIGIQEVAEALQHLKASEPATAVAKAA
jgi:hypothetical protein